MQTTLNHSYTISDFQNHLENTQRLLAETSALSESETRELASRLKSLEEITKSLKENGNKIGIFDSLYYNIGWGWENTALHKTKGTVVTLEHIIPQLKELQQKMATATAKYSEMQESVTFLCRNFQGLIDSNRVLISKVDGLETKVAEQNQKIDNLTAQNQQITAQNQQITAQNQEIMQMLRGMQNDRSSFVTTQASSFVSYTSNPSSTSFITSLD